MKAMSQNVSQALERTVTWRSVHPLRLHSQIFALGLSDKGPREETLHLIISLRRCHNTCLKRKSTHSK